MLRKIFSKVRRLVGSMIFRPHIRVDGGKDVIRIGSVYGGWSFVDLPELKGATIISCGLGEDASFDVEFATKYDAKVVLVDPTPKAIRHFEAMKKRFGLPALKKYTVGGKQPADAYDLSTLDESHFIMVEKAIWLHNGKIKFYAPKNSQHVSHSIVNFQNNYASDTPSIEVTCISVEELMADLQMASIPLMKLDIEGAETEVIADMLEKGIIPRQLLIEFDELGVPSRKSKEKYENTDRLLRKSGYRLLDFDGHSNFLYMQ